MDNNTMTLGQKKLLAARMPEAKKFWTEVLDGIQPSIFLKDKYSEVENTAPIIVKKIVLEKSMITCLLKIYDNSELGNIIASAVVGVCNIYSGEMKTDCLLRYVSLNEKLDIPLLVSASEDYTPINLINEIRAFIEKAQKYKDFPTEILNDSIDMAVIIGCADKTGFENESLIFSLYEYNNELILEIKADSNSYTEKTIDALGDKLEIYLNKICERNDINILDIDIFTQEDKNWYSLFNSTECAYSENDTLVSLIKKSFKKHGHKIAVYDGENSYTYSDFEKKVLKLAAYIQNNYKDEKIIGLMSGKSIDYLAGIYGILFAGKAYMPIDPNAPIERNKLIVAQSEINTIIYSNEYEEKVPEIKNCVDFNIIASTNYEYVNQEIYPDDLAYIIFTSGSTGIPKGVAIKHTSVINRIEWMHKEYPLMNGDVILHKTPATFDVSVWEIFWWAIVGQTVALLTTGKEADPEAVINVIKSAKVTTMHFVPSMLNAFIDYVNSANKIDEVSSLKVVFSSGEALKPNHVNKFYNLFNNIKLVNLYGPTEATVDVTHHETKANENPVVIGKPIDNTKIYIIGKKGKIRPINMVGELAIAGVQLAHGYLNDAEKTNDRFMEIESIGERIYFTGDLARYRYDGTIEYLGRNDRQIKVRGVRIEIGEIESAFYNEEYVSDVLVLDHIGNDNNVHLYAFVILKNKEISQEQLKEAISQKLLSYMMPEKIVLIDSMPLTANGKADRNKLLTLIVPNTKDVHVAARTESEKILSGIWKEVLDIEEVGIEDNFFELGGNSINFVSVLAKAREHGLKFTFQQLFSNPTIKGLLQNQSMEDDDPFKSLGLFELVSEEDKAKMPDYVEDAYPMSMLQSGLVYQSSIMDGDNNYHDIVSYEIHSGMNVEVFKQAVELLVKTQPIFRTSYNLNDYSEYLQIVHRTIDDLPLNVYDLRSITTREEQETIYNEWFWKEQHRPFVWNRPGLVQLHLHLLSEDSYIYSISQHNSALDGWSMNKVHTFLFKTYYDLLEGRSVSADRLSDNNHNKTFIYLEKKAISSPKFKQFWKDELKNAPNGVIPRSRYEILDKGNEVIFHDVDLPTGLSEKIINLANELKIPVKDILLASHIKFLSLLNKNNDVFSGYEIGGRPELLGAENALGVFLNTMPFRIKCNENCSWKDFILDVYNAEAKYLPYRRYSMAQVMKDMGIRGKLFDTVFNFTHFYSLKDIKSLPGFDSIDVRAAAITEFPLRVEYSRHFYNDSVELSLHYHTSKYDEKDIIEFGKVFIEILTNMVDHKDQNHNDINMNKYLERFTIYPEIEETNEYSANSQNNSISEEDLTSSVKKVKKIWSSILKLPVENIKDTDDFFEIGGNSLGALKVSLMLKNKVSLKNIMKKSKLYELAEEIACSDRNKVVDSNILQCLTKYTNADKNIVFLPYAGGNAINFMRIARAIEASGKCMGVYAAELPGHDANKETVELMSFKSVVKLISDEIEAKFVGKEVTIWGHCVGSSLALAVTQELEKRNFLPKKLFLAGKTFEQAQEFLDKQKRAETITFEDIRELYSEWSGSSELSRLGTRFESNMVKIFIHDANESNKYLYSIWKDKNTHLKTDSTIVITKDDPSTPNYKSQWKVWNKWIDSLNLKEFETGGHYFINTIPNEVTDYLLEEIG